MKIVTLAAPAAVNTGHPTKGFAELRQPIEGPLTVSDEEAQRLKDNDLLDGEPEDLPDGEPEDLPDDEPEAEIDDLSAMTVADLHILAVKEGAPLNDATKKAEIVAAIEKHRAERAA